MPFTDACAAEGRAADRRRDARASPGRAELGGGGRARLAGRSSQGRGGLCQSLQAGLRRPISTGRCRGAACRRSPRSKGATDGLIALTAGGGGRARPAARRRPGRQGARPISTGSQALFPDRLYIELSRRGDPVEEAAEDGADRPRLCARPAAGRDQPRRLRRARASTPRTTRCCASPSRPISRATTASRSSPEAWLKDGAAMAELFADLPEAIANTVGDRPALRGRRAASASRSCRALPATTRTKQLRRDAHAGLARARLDGPQPRRSAGLLRPARFRARRHHPAWASPAIS